MVVKKLYPVIILRMFKGMGMTWALREWQILIPSRLPCLTPARHTLPWASWNHSKKTKIMEKKVRFSRFPSWIILGTTAVLTEAPQQSPKNKKLLIVHVRNANRKSKSPFPITSKSQKRGGCSWDAEKDTFGRAGIELRAPSCVSALFHPPAQI